MEKTPVRPNEYKRIFNSKSSFKISNKIFSSHQRIVRSLIDKNTRGEES